EISWTAKNEMSMRPFAHIAARRPNGRFLIRTKTGSRGGAPIVAATRWIGRRSTRLPPTARKSRDRPNRKARPPKQGGIDPAQPRVSLQRRSPIHERFPSGDTLRRSRTDGIRVLRRPNVCPGPESARSRQGRDDDNRLPQQRYFRELFTDRRKNRRSDD